MALPPGAKKRAPEIMPRLSREYPELHGFLDHADGFQLLCAVILSAQSTDALVNRITPALFRAFPTPAAMAKASPQDVEKLVKSVTYFRSKSRYLVETSRLLVERHGGKVPLEMEALLALPGVARKTANVVRGYLAEAPMEGIAVDTHVKRLAYRLGLTREEDPVKVEADLMRLFPREQWRDLTPLLIMHGRAVCDARKPKCSACVLDDICPRKGVVVRA